MPLVTAQRLGVSDDQLLTFKCILSSMIDNELQKQRGPYSTGSIDLAVDYSPSGLLGRAAEITEISDSAFPFKTGMSVSKKSVAMYGYGGVELFKYDAPEGPNDDVDIEH